ncbi:MAG: hypothetical protein QOJ65_2165 [Fimbriimonadaceae bacterium]|jgi:Zn-finger nucleic acid-binding protein|nr:hypothetical protein [Fimbriimonadaceae bacterium]
MPLACPDCQTSLEDKSFYDIPISVCPNCAGIWLDKDDMYRIRTELNPDQIRDIEAKVAPKPNPLPAPSHNPHCPVCHQALLPYHYAGGPVVLHTCEKVCGIWVQDKEMDKVADVDEPAPEAVKVAKKYEEESKRLVDHYHRAEQLFRAFSYRRGWPLGLWSG